MALNRNCIFRKTTKHYTYQNCTFDVPNAINIHSSTCLKKFTLSTRSFLSGCRSSLLMKGLSLLRLKGNGPIYNVKRKRFWYFSYNFLHSPKNEGRGPLKFNYRCVIWKKKSASRNRGGCHIYLKPTVIVVLKNLNFINNNLRQF